MATTTTAARGSWTSVITIDLLWAVLSRSVFHPFVAWLVPLCLRALGYSSWHPHVVNTSIWAGIVSLMSILWLIDTSIADGMPRDIDWEDEVVVVTGGANGLGRIIVESYAMKGVSVAALDVRLPSDKEIADSEALSRENVRWYKCDVSSIDEVQATKTKIEKDLGTVTILINNAGIVHGLPLLSMTTKQVASTININLLGQFHTIRTFLPSMLSKKNGGTIVTVASVLGTMGAAQLTDYAASKAGLISMHHSLSAELKTAYADKGGKNIRAILVTPGQLATDLFYGMETPSSFLGPVVEPVQLANAIVKSIDTGLEDEISLPLYAEQSAWFWILPRGMRRIARYFSGIDRATAAMQQRRTALTKKGE